MVIPRHFNNLSGKTGTFKRNGNDKDKLIVKAWVKSGGNHNQFGSNGEPFDFNESSILAKLGLNNANDPYNTPDWDDFYDYVIAYKSGMRLRDTKIDDAGYRFKFGSMLYYNMLFKNYPRYSQTKDLWMTRHYPFHAVKEGTSLLLDFLEGLEFGDHVGIVTYDSAARTEKVLVDTNMNVNVTLGDEWITDDYDSLDYHSETQNRLVTTMYILGLVYGLLEAKKSTNQQRPFTVPDPQSC